MAPGIFSHTVGRNDLTTFQQRSATMQRFSGGILVKFVCFLLLILWERSSQVVKVGWLGVRCTTIDPRVIIQHIIVYSILLYIVIMILMPYNFFLIGVSWDSKTSTLISKLIMFLEETSVSYQISDVTVDQQILTLEQQKTPWLFRVHRGSYYTQV